MSFWQPFPVFDFLTPTDGKTCMPWKARQEMNLTRNQWSEPYPLICSGSTPAECEEEARGVSINPDLLVLGISPATCAIGPKGIEVWTMTIIVQRRVSARTEA